MSDFDATVASLMQAWQRWRAVEVRRAAAEDVIMQHRVEEERLEAAEDRLRQEADAIMGEAQSEADRLTDEERTALWQAGLDPEDWDANRQPSRPQRPPPSRDDDDDDWDKSAPGAHMAYR
jgi:cell division septum initiation protein DivIVA